MYLSRRMTREKVKALRGRIAKRRGLKEEGVLKITRKNRLT